MKRVLVVMWPPFGRRQRGAVMAPVRRHSEPEVRIPPELAGPVEVALARSVDQIPGPYALPGGSRYEVEWDGYLH